MQLREEVRRIQLELGITTMYVTHDQEEALSVSDRVAVMSSGRIEQVGSPAEIYGHPRTPFVASFVGTMNHLEATVVSSAAGKVRCGPAVLDVGLSAASHSDGAVVTLYVRPEHVRAVAVAPGQDVPAELFEGKVTSLTFLGPVTRVGIASGLGGLLADVSSSVALNLAIDSTVGVAIEAGSLRSLALT